MECCSDVCVRVLRLYRVAVLACGCQHCIIICWSARVLERCRTREKLTQGDFLYTCIPCMNKSFLISQHLLFVMSCNFQYIIMLYKLSLHHSR
jgi:hypothetical protein